VQLLLQQRGIWSLQLPQQAAAQQQLLVVAVSS
jgi:hypothetical protein